MAAMAAPGTSSGGSGGEGGGGGMKINQELWYACAGPLVSLPPAGSLVVYFPQGHSEQVAASMRKDADAKIPSYPNLPSKLICILHSVTMHADPDTDEVYAQMTLQPVSNVTQCDKETLLATELALKQTRSQTEFFCKTLTASDTSTHGGFSVPRRAAERIFPHLDFSMQPPAQELQASDLHGSIWTFRHIYRGQPKRHLLTTGWSLFVSGKRLLAGDSVLFIRSLRNMESNPENSMISPTENSVSPPSGKKRKTLSDKDGDALHQVVIYKNDKSDRGQDVQSESHLSLEPSKPSKTSKRALVKNIGAFAAQCAKCQKWRLISTKEKYEEIRERIREDPFICEKAREWKPDVTCSDPSDVTQDGIGLFWAIDKPDIAQAPQGWERLIKIRGEGSTKFADVYYRSPTRIQLRSTNEVEKYLAEHPEYVAQGVELSHFSFKSPAPLQKDYVRKRTQTSQSGVTHTGSSKLLQLEDVQPISWAAPRENKQLVIYNEDQFEPPTV